MENRLSLDYYYGKEAEQFRFMPVPLALFEEPYQNMLTSDAKLLYSFMLHRMGLSIKNHWIDDSGRPYIIFKNATICEKLGCKKDKARKLLEELDSKNGIGLIERVPGAKGGPEIIYVKNFIREINSGVDGKNVPLMERRLEPVDISADPGEKNQRVPLGKTDTNEKIINYMELSDNESSHLSRSEKLGEERADAYRKLIRKNIEYDDFMKIGGLGDKQVFDDLYEIICDLVCSDGDYIRIKGEKKPYEIVRKKFLEIGPLEMEYAMQHLEENTNAIRKPREYAIATLYDASLSANLSITQKVQHDLAYPDCVDARSFG